MTPREAQENLIAAIENAPSYIGGWKFSDGPNVLFPTAASTVDGVIQVASRIKQDPKFEKRWVDNSRRLLDEHDNWAQRFGLVAKKLQEGARFAPSEIKAAKATNTLDPALHNVLADGWHHTPITQPLEP